MNDPTTSEHYAVAVMAGHDGFLVLDRAGRIVEANEAFARQSGYAQDELAGLSFAHLDLTGLGLASRPMTQGAELRDGRQRKKDGSLWDVEYALSYHGDRWFLFCRDVTHRKATEGLLAARDLLSRIGLEGSLDEVIQATLDAAETVTGSRIGFFHFVEENQIDLTLQCWSTNTLRQMCNAEGKGAHYPIDLAGVWVDCVRTRRPVIHNDYDSLPHKRGLPEGHAPVVRELLLPVMRGDLIAAVLGVGNKATPYTERDVDLVGTLASLCIDLVAHKRAEEQARASAALADDRGRVTLRASIETFCRSFAIPLSDERRAQLSACDEAQLQALFEALCRDRAWP